MNVGLPEEHRVTLEMLLNLGVFQKMNKEVLKMDRGGVSIACSDPDQSGDVFRYLRRLCLEHRAFARIGPITLPGAPLLIAPESKVRQIRPGAEGIIFGALDLCNLTGMKALLIKPHWPCRAAAECELGILESLHLLFAGKRYIRDLLDSRASTTTIHPRLAKIIATLKLRPEPLQIIPCFHIDWQGRGEVEDPRKQTFFANERSFESYCAVS